MKHLSINPSSRLIKTYTRINFTNPHATSKYNLKGGAVTIESQLRVKIHRNAKVSTHPFTRYFKGFERINAVRSIFGERTEDVLRNLKVEFSGRRGYMGVSDIDGHLIISAYYLNNGNMIDIYLDIIHELVHVRQSMEGKELFDNRYNYIDRPTEIEAYRHTIEEARNLGLNDKQICEYLKTEWMNDEELKRLAKTLNVKYEYVEEKKKDRRRRF